MRRSDFESLSVPDALALIAEQSGIKWDAEDPEGLPKIWVFEKSGHEGFALHGATKPLTFAQAREAARLLSLLPEIRKLTDVAGRVCGGKDLLDRLFRIRDLLLGAKS